MKKFLFIAILILSASFASKAQDYQTAIGLRLGLYNGFSIKHFVKPSSAIEGILTMEKNSFHVTGLYEYHKNFPDVDFLKWYFGGGVSIRNYNDKYDNLYLYNVTSIGLVGVIGLEYTFEEIPLSLGIDWMPYIPFVNDDYGFGYNGGGLTVRYTF